MSIVTNIPSVDDYANADRSGKSNMRSMAQSAMADAIRSGDIATATAWMTAMDAWKSNTRSTTAPTDWNALASVRIATLRRAADMIESGAVRPNGIPDEIELSFDSSATADDDVATRIATESIKRSEKRPLRSYIATVVESNMRSGEFYTVADVAHMIESEFPDYGRVSHGAVRNALESNKIPNVTFVPATNDAPRGCRKS